MGAPKGHPKYGGKKKGSKHKKTIEQEKALEFLREAIREHLPELIRNKLELARGIWCEKLVEVKDKKGKVKITKARVYREKPDSGAIDSLLDRVVGKPASLMDFGALIPTTVIINVTSEEVAKAKKRIESKKNGK